MIYFTSDLHFNHKNIITHSRRPFKDKEEMGVVMIANWNNTVSHNDTVIIVGDFCFGGKEKWRGYLSRLKGKKILVRGNHDQRVPKECFEKVCDIHEFKYNGTFFQLCHYPMSAWNGMFRNNIMIHGHTHEKDGQFGLPKMPNSFNVGVDLNNFTPVSIDEILDKKVDFTEECKRLGLLS